MCPQQALFWLGPVEEQGLIVNVRGFGLVLLSGCGHPPIERTLAVAERVLDIPVQGVVERGDQRSVGPGALG
jgi:7,8-dihydropterin-6-yl-methyl-4-(beta-D-ribofuranosyl)aminobenzene 5'-phosphate synthase